MIIAVTNLKGGVGKTTITTNLAVSFAHKGYDVCIVDTDLGQQSSMEWSGSRDENRVRIPVFGVSIKQLNKEVEALQQRFDIVMIDGTPQLSELADRTILASDILVIPLMPSIYDFRGFENFLERFEQIRGLKEANGGQVDALVVLNRVVPKTNVSKEIKEAIAEYEVKLLDTRLCNRVAYADSATDGLGVVEYKDAKAKKEINQLTDELISIIRKYTE